ncbi:enoyl-CoA hydratase/carnithine racemase [Desulfosporosinus orientis DSM 765]|uniref:short-chain-enoyl-CoA hydratase n=1 Tax=Desulfosporosinus orientis (strain ATCC 19365 / DSM 765 / NCIMB 8382 / VKM B-1628 / Singapore I) TaxID=768706 RepID=G7WID6_DESOD|nr:enoyl-CoA hydratase-related protein [Desulfosporosinus orientis]AET68584.1 enoyl-CoA hydratase/carnithine racemase [Desulfosporosinus orientis DSM 765]
MEFKNLIYTQEDGLGIITLNRPKALNALCDELTGELGELISVLQNDTDLRVIILTGGNIAFAAGADIVEMMDKDSIGAYRSIIKTHDVFDRLEEFRVPVIAAINGPCMGGGCELALCCDMRIAGSKALFALPEVSLGIIPGCGGTQRLTQLVGPALAKELIYLAAPIHAAKAQEIGLVNKVVDDDKVMEEAKAIANKLMERPALALRFAKEAVNCGVKTDLTTGKNMELARFTMLFSSEDQKEGMKAFYEKRKPLFKDK